MRAQVIRAQLPSTVAFDCCTQHLGARSYTRTKQTSKFRDKCKQKTPTSHLKHRYTRKPHRTEIPHLWTETQKRTNPPIRKRNTNRTSARLPPHSLWITWLTEKLLDSHASQGNRSTHDDKRMMSFQQLISYIAVAKIDTVRLTTSKQR